jgi:hypothetical protein
MGSKAEIPVRQEREMSRDTSKLLIDEHPLQVLPTLACKVGLNGAIILQQVHYWLGIAKKAKDDRKFKDGRWWVYNTYEEWQENFPWWSLPTIKRTILRLETNKLLISREMDAQDWDHTKWYTIDYETLNGLIDCIKVIPSEESDRGDGVPQDDSLLIEPETTTETTNTEIVNKAVMDLFISRLGKFKSQSEAERWVILHDSVGTERADQLVQWAFKKEIHLANRPSLLDSIETAAKKWREPSGGRKPQRVADKQADGGSDWLCPDCHAYPCQCDEE